MMESKTITPQYVLKNILRFAGFLVLLGIFIFVPAGTLAYWQGWVFLAAFGFAIVVFMLYGMLRDPNMLKERSQKAKNVKHWDTVILNIYTVFLVIMVVLAPLDGGRFHWSHVPLWVNLLGLGLMIPSFGLLMWVTATNTYLSRYVRIQDDRGHQVISSGPYRYVRHPMYASNILFFPSIPLLLGSWWALIPAVIIMGLFTLRTYLEDKTLQAELPGYKEYAQKTRYRMVPGIW
jgi:protein-S-isoprenylcysteine O-methyltransferase Ste14